ncbi:LOW QUALITY PROTEIN: hypothetical protein ACHAXA_004764, partial [Cyclostephanos tholiformis]
MGKEANVYYAKAGKAATASPIVAAARHPWFHTHEEHCLHQPWQHSNVCPPPLPAHHQICHQNIQDVDTCIQGSREVHVGRASIAQGVLQVWAEKEMRTYRRIYSVGIPCPAPVLLKGHVFIMECLGNGSGWPSLHIHDAGLSGKQFREAYIQTILIMRHMYQRCKLVCGDLSKTIFFGIRMRCTLLNSIETDHRLALNFLRKDASNVNNFYRKADNLNVMTTWQLFEFVTSTCIDDDSEAEAVAMDAIMNRIDVNMMLMENSMEDERRVRAQHKSMEEAVFMSQFLPRSLNQVTDYNMDKIEEGDV